MGHDFGLICLTTQKQREALVQTAQLLSLFIMQYTFLICNDNYKLIKIHLLTQTDHNNCFDAWIALFPFYCFHFPQTDHKNSLTDKSNYYMSQSILKL